ncbi:MAG: hypothetical protein Q7J22_01625 [Candidatus Wolfebacteria bacterium]|nr:hypothetical protein [Candidatus Wolfebacteria bacterium]
MTPDLGHQIKLGKLEKDKGIWQAVKAQLLHTPKYWGYEGKIENEKACRAWADRQTREILMDTGYMDRETGLEATLTSTGGEASFVLEKGDDEHVGISEFTPLKTPIAMIEENEEVMKEQEVSPAPIENIQASERRAPETIQTEFGPITKDEITLGLRYAEGTIQFGAGEDGLPRIRLHFGEGHEPEILSVLNSSWETAAGEAGEDIKKKAAQLAVLPEIILAIKKEHPTEAQFLKYLMGRVIGEYEKNQGVDVFKNVDDIMGGLTKTREV